MSRSLHRYSVFVACATFLLVIAGGLVTSTGSGLAVPDWPLSFGQVFPRMEGGVLFEHGHRLVATTVGLLTIVLAVWILRTESRGWVRAMGWALVPLVVVQGVLGGLTVRLLLPVSVSAAHAGIAQLFFALTVVLADVTGARFWVLGAGSLENTVPTTQHLSSATASLALWTAVAVYAQILIGAVVRHIGAGLAIPTFPLADGRLIPVFTSVLVAWQFAHRVFGLVATAFVICCAVRVFRRHGATPWLVRPAAALLMLVAFQVYLGALTIWSQRAIVPTTAHVATGALLFVTAVVLAIRAHRVNALPVAQASQALEAEPA